MLAIALALSLIGADPLTAGDHVRSVDVDGRTRTYRVHVPPRYDPKNPTPVVLAYHGALMNGSAMSTLSGLNKKSDEALFLAVYPNGNGTGERMLVWNAGESWEKPEDDKRDDVAFTARLLDDLETVAAVDAKRVYATGMSNGAMMSYRVAAELSDRIAAIAPVGGTMAIKTALPKRPVPVIHFHGTEDRLVPYKGPDGVAKRLALFKSVDDTMQIWVKINGCPVDAVTALLPNAADDGTTVTCKTWGPGKNGTEVVLYIVEGGGHTWPGRPRPHKLLGKTTTDISANDLIWEFFSKHPLE